jgi:hypothetical protein
MAFTPVNDGDLAVAPQLQQVLDALQGVADAGQPLSFTALDDDTTYALTVRNLGSGGLGLDVRGSDDVSRLLVNDSGVVFGSGAVGFPFGTVSAPGWFFSGDTNTGLYHPSSDVVAITTGGTERGRFSSSGLTLTTGSILVSAGGLTLSSGAMTGVVRDKGGQVYDVMAYGALGTGSATLISDLYGSLAAAQVVYPGCEATTETVDLAATKSAVRAAEAAGNGAVVWFPPGTYCINATLNIHKGIYLQSIYGDDDVDGDLGKAESALVNWVGANGGTMILFQSATTANVLAGGGILGLTLDGCPTGATTAGTAIWLKGTQGTRIWAKVRNVNVQGLLLDDWVSGGVGAHAQENRVEYFDFHHGFGNPGGVGDDACGIVLDGSSKNPVIGGVTFNKISRLRGSYYNGDLLQLRYADQNHVGTVHPIPVAGGVGKAVRFKTSDATSNSIPGHEGEHPTHGFPAGNILDQVNGKVYVESWVHNNRINRHSSEDGIIELQDVSNAHLSYRAFDYTDGSEYETHVFKMIDQQSFGPPFATAQGSPSTSGIASLWASGVLPNAADTAIGGVRTPHAWHSGTITKVRIRYSNDVAVANTGFLVRLRLSTLGYGVVGSSPTPPSFGTGEYDSGNTRILADSSTGRGCIVDFSPNLAYAIDDTLDWSFQRVGTDNTATTGDDNTGNLFIREVTFYYAASGPLNTGGAGSYTTSPPALMPLP